MSSRVLVVDDEQSLAKVMASYLERDGHEVASQQIPSRRRSWETFACLPQSSTWPTTRAINVHAGCRLRTFTGANDEGSLKPAELGRGRWAGR
jgi:hypothetical protein